jgi:hypothetical protein
VLAACVAAPAYADHAPTYVVPGRVGVPVVINGYDASHAVVEGDWGLSRPGHVAPTIVSGPLVAPAPFYRNTYFPAFGRRPGYGRYEVDPPSAPRPPRPAPGFYREWGAESGHLSATVEPSPYPLPVIEAAPQINLHGPRRLRRHR